jgi:general stress protein CsbA
MYSLDPTSLLRFLRTLFEIIGGALVLDAAAFRAVLNAQAGWYFALTVLILAGTSLTLGQSVVLFLNRVSRSRFLASIVVSVFLFAAGALAWIGSSWLIGTQLFAGRQSLGNVAAVISLGYAPLIFGFLVLVPYFGPFIDRLLDTWSLLASLVAIMVAFSFSFGAALITALLGWLIVTGLRRFLLGPLQVIEGWLWRQFVGVQAIEHPENTQQFLEQFQEQFSRRLRS